MNEELTLEQLKAEAEAEKQDLKAAQDEIAMLKEQVEKLRGIRHYTVPSPNTGNTLLFGLVSCTHHGSNFARTDALREFYGILHHEKIPTCFNCGDILDGSGMYKGQEFEQNAIGLSAQLEILKREKPDVPVRTIFITGNHDYSFYKRNGVPVWDLIASATGWTFVGRDRAWLELTTADGKVVNVGLAHPGGGTAYAVSYKSQKYVEAIPGGAKPDILGIGNYHKADHMPMFRNVHAIQTGCFQSQTPFMAAQPTEAHVGGWIVKVVVGERGGLVGRVSAEFVSFYEPTERIVV